MNKLIPVFIITSVILFTGCSEESPYPSASSVSAEWLKIKNDLLTKQDAETGSLTVSIDNFNQLLKDFFASPVGSIYQVHRPEEARLIKNTDAALVKLKSAVMDNGEIFPLIHEIDININTLQSIDADLSNISMLRVFLLFFFFAVFIITAILVMMALYRSLRIAKSREKQSLIFSRETVMAQEHERRRIARELHDTVAQDLWRLSFQTDSIDKTADSAERSRLTGEVVKGQKEIMQRIRSLCDTLIPPDFQRRGLVNSLNSLCYDFHKRSGIECHITIKEELSLKSLDNDTQLQCFRIVQECLSNIEKHSGAAEVSVLVFKQEDDTMVVCVSDNGKGFKMGDEERENILRTEGHFGLWGMYERASYLKGTLSIDSEEGEGTTVTLKIPAGESKK